MDHANAQGNHVKRQGDHEKDQGNHAKLQGGHRRRRRPSAAEPWVGHNGAWGRWLRCKLQTVSCKPLLANR